MPPMSIIIFVLYVVEVSQATEIVYECKAKQKNYSYSPNRKFHKYFQAHTMTTGQRAD